MRISSYLANCAAFQTADQLRRVQRVAYRTRQLAEAYPDRGFGSAERRRWEGDADWQPTREAIERLTAGLRLGPGLRRPEPGRQAGRR